MHSWCGWYSFPTLASFDGRRGPLGGRSRNLTNMPGKRTNATSIIKDAHQLWRHRMFFVGMIGVIFVEVGQSGQVRIIALNAHHLAKTGGSIVTTRVNCIVSFREVKELRGGMSASSLRNRLSLSPSMNAITPSEGVRLQIASGSLLDRISVYSTFL